MKALLLEDSRTAAEEATRELRAAGYRVFRFGSALAARCAVALGPFELYLVDVAVPEAETGGEGDGLAFVVWLRALHPEAHVIVWSADDRRAEAEALGATFVRKGELLALLLAR